MLLDGTRAQRMTGLGFKGVLTTWAGLAVLLRREPSGVAIFGSLLAAVVLGLAVFLGAQLSLLKHG